MKVACFPINGLWYHPWWRHTYFYVALAVFLLALATAALVLVVRLIKQRRARRQIWEIACDDLRALTQRPCRTAQESARTYALLTQTVKNYFAQRYALDLVGKTDAEFLQEVARQIAPAQYLLLERVTQDAQTVKFARQETVSDRLATDVSDMVEVIQATVTVRAGDAAERAS